MFILFKYHIFSFSTKRNQKINKFLFCQILTDLLNFRSNKLAVLSRFVVSEFFFSYVKNGIESRIGGWKQHNLLMFDVVFCNSISTDIKFSLSTMTKLAVIWKCLCVCVCASLHVCSSMFICLFFFFFVLFVAFLLFASFIAIRCVRINCWIEHSTHVRQRVELYKQKHRPWFVSPLHVQAHPIPNVYLESKPIEDLFNFFAASLRLFFTLFKPIWICLDLIRD